MDDGYLIVSSKKPKGYFVKEIADGRFPFQRFFPLEKMIRYHFNEKEKLFLDIFCQSENEALLSLGGIVMDKAAYPDEGIREIVLHLANASQNEAERMKRNICSLLFQENMYINPKNIQLVSETNQALNHLMTLYLKEGDCVIAEEPSFPTMPASSATRASSWSPFPWRPTAWIWTSWRPPSRKYAPKFIYTMPNYHNPTGIVMSLEKRHRLLEITGKYCIPVIEEDSQRDFRYEGGRLPTLYSLDRYRSVVYLDSFTLTFPYGIKTGYIVGAHGSHRYAGPADHRGRDLRQQHGTVHAQRVH